MELLKNYWIYVLGFIGQSLFGARLIVQWFHSEKEGKVVSPTLYWKLSLIAATIILIYGILRKDVIIIAGQVLSYYIYIRNLQLKNSWQKLGWFVQTVLLGLPVAVLFFLFFGSYETFERIFFKSDLTHPLLIIGAIGQMMLNFRFIYQWYYSEKRGISVLPLGFWIISLFASLMILIYAFYKKDPVLLVSQGMGIFAYVRNLLLYKRTEKSSA